MLGFGKKKEDKDMSEKNKDVIEAEKMLQEIGLPERGQTIRIVKFGPPEWEGESCLGVGDGVLKTYNADDVPSWEELQNALVAGWGGGDYELTVRDPDGRVIKRRRFAIPVDKYPPKTRKSQYSRGSAADMRDMLMLLRPPVQDNTSVIQAIIQASNQNIEALKLMIQQSNADQQARREEQRAAIQLMLETVTRNTQAMMEAFKSSKEDTIQILSKLIEDTRAQSASITDAMVSALMTGLQIGTNMVSPPKSEFAQIVTDIASALKSTIEAKSESMKAVVSEAAKEAVSKMARTIPVKVANNVTTPSSVPDKNTDDTKEDDSRIRADAILDTILEALTNRPEVTNITQSIAANVPKDMLHDATTLGGVDKVFRWLEEHGTREKVERLTEMLKDGEAKQWLVSKVTAEVMKLRT